MKKHLTTLFLILLFSAFAIFISIAEKSKNILNVITPNKITIDDKSGEKTVCIENIEAFSLEPDEEFFDKYSKELQLSKIDMISLGYLAQEFAQKTLYNQRVTIELSGKITSECEWGKVKLNGIDYKNLIDYSGFGLAEGKIAAPDKFKKNLEKARKLDLVVLNHHSGKYHTLTCPYGEVAHDMVIIPKKQLPKSTKPCKFCHQQKPKKYRFKKGFNIFKPHNIPQPPLSITDGDVKFLVTDFTKQLKPNTMCQANVCKELVNTINSANNTLDIAIYGYQEVPAITQALKNAKSRGVKIRFVYDQYFNPAKDYYKDNQIILNLADEYKSDRGEKATPSNMLMHNKFIIIDNKTVFTGSMNLSPTGLSGYDVNNIVVIHSKEIAEIYTKEFEQMLSGKFHKQKEKLNLPNKFIVGSTEIEVYFSPKDKASVRIRELLQGAKHYIYIPAFLITHSEITNELVQAKQRGVDIRIIIDANSTNMRNSKHSLLRQSGILLKTENYAGKLHSKSMIIDDEYVIAGSMNFSNSGENKNDENLLVIKNPKLAKFNKEFFLYLWTVIPNKYLKRNARAESRESIGACADGIDNNFNGKIDMQEDLCKGKQSQ
ncbi:MAG: phospholipase D-like domain-containing protein [Muribaculaceae bacterium]|nr:phospholipase D-like domain-containing protein [Muribaculaceae bacterium]